MIKLTDEWIGQLRVGSEQGDTIAIGAESGVNTCKKQSLDASKITHTTVVGNIFALCLHTVDALRCIDGAVQRTKVVVLVDDTLSHSLKALRAVRVQPRCQLANTVPLHALILKNLVSIN